jgi:hypothetical protein
MYCHICGSENNVKFYLDKGMQSLCDLCAEETPEKIDKHRFDIAYWGEDYQEVPLEIRKEFYDDYRVSTHSFEEYVITTKEENNALV